MSSEETGSSARDYWDHVEEVFAAALAAEDSARTAVLDARCAARAELRAEVEALLAAHARAGEFITPRTLGGSVAPAFDDRGAGPGTRIGAFRLLERIAHGGMGEVYRAERVEGEFTQQVAIKLIAARLQGADTVRRFRAERQILASLQHPNIVSLLDGGVTADGQPFIVMEYIHGVSITEYCRRHAVPLEARLRLFQQLCTAVGFAHRHLVVHRDLKPGNVFVTSEGVVKVLDFGVAKLLEPQDPQAAATVSLLGPMTPNYASPEQIRGLPVTTSCDVYALGVMLYELLSGGRPYETAAKTVDEVVRIVIEQEPVRPSAAPGKGLPYDGRRLRGDLDAVVLKAMAKDPGGRYASAEELGDDVARILAAKPVVAREPSLLYLTRKAIARHRATFTVAAIFLVLLVTALVGALWQATIAARERGRAVQRFNDVRQLAGALIFRIHDEVAPLAGSTPVRETIIAEGLKFLERLEVDAAADPGLRLELAQAYLRIGNVQGRLDLGSLGRRDGAIRSYRRARDLAVPLARTDGGSWDAVKALVDARLALGRILEPVEGKAEASAALTTAAEWQAREPESARGKELLARAHFDMAVLTGYPSSLPHWRETNRLFTEVLAEQPDQPIKIRNVALSEKYLGGYFEEAGATEKALEHYQRAYALDEKRVKASPGDRQAQLDLAIDMANVSYSYEKRREYVRAIDFMRRSLAIRERLSDTDPKDVYTRVRLAYVHYRLADLYLIVDEVTSASRHARIAVSLYAQVGGMDRSPEPAAALHTLGNVERRLGQKEAACAAYVRAHAEFRALGVAPLGEFYEPVKAAAARAVAVCGSR